MMYCMYAELPFQEPELCAGWPSYQLALLSKGCCFGPGSEVYYLTCAVKLPEDEEFPPAPLTTRGEAVAFEID